MSLKHTLASLAVAAALMPAAGCVVSARGHVAAPTAYVEVEEEPPPPRTVVVETRPGFIWIEGRWVRNSGRWVWRDGYYERERSGHVWVQGRWAWDGYSYRWMDGYWTQARPGFVWVDGYWSRGPRGRWRWVEGYWLRARPGRVPLRLRGHRAERRIDFQREHGVKALPPRRWERQ